MIVALLALAAAQPTESPKAFMEQTYARYRSSSFSPLNHPDRYFAPRLTTAISEDARLARGEVGYLDGDPICQCQDTAGMKPRVLKVTNQGAGKASVLVLIDWQDSTARKARFSLVKVHGRWRIADVSSADGPSLLSALEKSNRKLRAKR
jgi:hypothetical protein